MKESLPASLRSPARSRPWRSRLGVDEVWVQGRLSSRLFLTLRWIALAGQGGTLFVADRIGIGIPWTTCLSVLGFTLLSNFVMEWWNREVAGELRGAIFHVALWDLISLTILLHSLGGLDNPFSIFYLVQLTVVTVALRYEGIAGLALVALSACGFLWFYHEPITTKTGLPPSGQLMALGRLVALVLAGATILLLLVAVRWQSSTLRRRHERLQQKLEAQDRFLSVATLATGFAHELATPLGTISITASELAAAGEPDSPAAVIQREAARCEKVLHRLRDVGQEAIAGASPDEEIAPLVRETLALLPADQQSRIRVEIRQAEKTLVRPAGLSEALLVVLRNALQSSPRSAPVDWIISEDDRGVCFEILDEGPGFDETALQRGAEPFFTTKVNGLGLGLYFVRRLVASQGGALELENRPNGGGAVRIRLAAAKSNNSSRA